MISIARKMQLIHSDISKKDNAKSKNRLQTFVCSLFLRFFLGR